MKATRRINTLLTNTLGIKIQRTRWRESKKPEWPDPTPIGMVEHFGRKEITGWVSASAVDYPIKVTLNVNGYPIHSTWANVNTTLNTRGLAQSFYIGTKGIWDFCKKSDRLTVRVDNKILPIQNKGVYERPRDTGTKTLNELKTMLASGYIFNRRGTLQLSKKLDLQWQKQMIGLYNQTSKVLKKTHAITPFLIYGSLLGQVREGGFIGHDDDLDFAYLSKHRSGPEAAKELVDIAKTFKKNGYDVELKASAIHIHNKDHPEARIDLFHLFFNEKDELSFAFGVAGTSQFMLNDWKGIVKDTLAGYPVSIPRNTEKLVECIYGSSWRTPIIGFNWNHARTRRERSSIVPRDIRDKFNNTNSTNPSN